MKFVVSALRAIRSEKGLKGQLLRGGVGSIAVKVGSTFINVLLAVVLARALGADGFGIYSFIFALITIMAIPAQMGLSTLVVRETAKAHAASDWALMKGLWRWSTLIAVAMSAALIAIGVLAGWVFSDRLPQGGLVVFYWGLVLVPLIALGNLRGAALRGLRNVVQGQLPEFILRPSFLIALVLGGHLGLSTYVLTASDAMMLHAVASLMAFAIGTWLLLRARPREIRAQVSSSRHTSLWLKSALPLGIVEGMQLVNHNVGLIALGIATSSEDVGLYRIALQGGMLVSIGLTAINMVIGPYIARLHEQGRFEALQQLVTWAARIAFVLSLMASSSLIIAGPALLTILFGEEYGAAYLPLVIVSLAQVVNSVTGCVGQILYMTRHEHDVATAISLGAICNVVLAFALTPTLGSIGSAIAMMAGTVLWNILLVMRVHQRTGLVAIAFWKRKAYQR